MRKAQLQTLSKHFFRQFFQGDGAGSDASSETAMVRAMAGVATPPLMAAFWIALLARNLHSWTLAAVHSFFVTYTFCAMGCVTALQWESLFPDRMDFLILLPLPVRAGELFLAKLQATGRVVLLFLFAAGIAGTLLLPTLQGRSMPRAMVAHAVAVSGAGLASSMMVLALEGLVIVVTPERWFRWVAPVVQTLLVAACVLLFLLMNSLGTDLRLMLQGSMPHSKYFPLLWFDGLYETAVGGLTATPTALALSRWALLCLPGLLLLIAVTYPAAWRRRRRMALEGGQGARLRDPRLILSALHGTVLRRADDRAIFHFVRQTLFRLSRYHVLLAAYCGTGLAISVACAVHIHGNADRLEFSLWRTGVQGALPLLLFWTVAGLQVAFLLPSDLGARWIFRLAPLHTYQIVSTTKLFVLAVCAVVVVAFAATLALCGWHGFAVAAQCVFGLMYALLLTDLFFYFQASVPFTRPRTPGHGSLPLTLATFVFGAPVTVVLAITLERWVGNSVWKLALACAAITLLHVFQRWLRALPSHAVSDDAFLGENDTEVQTLGLST